MKLRELTNIQPLNVAHSTTIKGGARDSGGTKTGGSPYSIIIKI
jgi:hypothetical protein